jgi:hypothetical protein
VPSVLGAGNVAPSYRRWPSTRPTNRRYASPDCDARVASARPPRRSGKVFQFDLEGRHHRLLRNGSVGVLPLEAELVPPAIGCLPFAGCASDAPPPSPGAVGLLDPVFQGREPRVLPERAVVLWDRGSPGRSVGLGGGCIAPCAWPRRARHEPAPTTTDRADPVRNPGGGRAGRRRLVAGPAQRPATAGLRTGRLGGTPHPSKGRPVHWSSRLWPGPSPGRGCRTANGTCKPLAGRCPVRRHHASRYGDAGPSGRACWEEWASTRCRPGR